MARIPHVGIHTSPADGLRFVPLTLLKTQSAVFCAREFE